MGEERGGLWGESQGDHKRKVLQEERKVARGAEGSRLGSWHLAGTPPSTSCPRARKGQGPERQQGEEGAAKARLAQKWRKKRAALGRGGGTGPGQKEKGREAREFSQGMTGSKTREVSVCRQRKE